MPDSNGDKDLLERFKALKGTATTIEQTTSSDQQPDDLAARFLRFSAKEQDVSENTLTTNTASAEEDDKTLEELLADLGPQDQWLVGSDESEEVLNLMIEARASLLSNPGENEADSIGGDENGSLNDASQAAAELSAETQDEAKNSVRSAIHLQKEIADDPDEPTEVTSSAEDEEASLALQKILDELSLENTLSNQNLLPMEEESTSASEHVPQAREETPPEPVLDLPSTPDAIPLPRKVTDPMQSTGLDLPSAPSIKPSKKKPKTTLPTYTNEEIESWCIICNDDATVQCNGCDGDLYCAKCWREGHTGPDAGYEEKRHRWAKYTKPK